MIPVSDTDTPAPAAVPPLALPLVYALTDAECAMFFGEDDTALPAAGAVRYRPESGGWEAFLERTAPAVLISCWATPPLPVRWLEGAGCPLRYVCHLTGSVRNIVPRSFIERGGLVSNWGSLAAAPVAEHALLLALMALRNGGSWRHMIETSTEATPPTQRLQTRSLFGRRVGIHGFGRVARELLRLLRPFGVQVFAYSEGMPGEMISAGGATPCASLAELFSASEILFECEALHERSAGCVTAEVLACLPDGAVFVNVGRGKLVDEVALERESASGRIRVALDVVASEPATSALSFLQHGDAIISPHIAGPTFDIYRRCAELASENIRRYAAGLEVANRISLQDYDRST